MKKNIKKLNELSVRILKNFQKKTKIYKKYIFLDANEKRYIKFN